MKKEQALFDLCAKNPDMFYHLYYMSMDTISHTFLQALQADWDIHTGIYFHDIGKLVISPRIINKPDKLTAFEYQEVKKHAMYGYLLQCMWHATKTEQQIALYHHERWDGSGYFGLRGEQIPWCARVVAILDVYSAMRCKRVYSQEFSYEQIREEFLANKEKFDPYLLNIFLYVLDQVIEATK